MRRTKLSLLYNTEKISEDIQRFLLSFSFNDNSSGEADDISITLEDRDKLWENDWQPEVGDSLEAALVAKGFRQDDTGRDIEEQLYCGYFEIDEIGVSYPPSVVNIKAISTCESTALRGETSTKAWEQVTLKAIADDISKRAEMELQYYAKYMPFYRRRDQTDQSDLAFLLDLCNRAGLSLKVSDDSLIIFDEEEQEKLDPVVKYDVKAVKSSSEPAILNYSFKRKTRDVYRACLIQYADPNTNKTTKYIFEPPNPPATGKLMKVNEKVDSMADAERLARKRLREKNIKENTASMTLIGDTRLVAGVCIDVNGVGKYSGKYYINKATHSYSGSGYTTSLEMWKAGIDYTVKFNAYTVTDSRKPRKRSSKKSKNRDWVGKIDG